jgi:cell fate (sporulation/competence/biofilm development) regulator YlbF (YheA/YmcA/DUF963 family)
VITGRATGKHFYCHLDVRAMSVDTDTAPEGTQEIEELATALGEKIAEFSEYETFLEKKRAVEVDEQTQEKISEFEHAQREFMLARQQGDATQEDMQHLQETQDELHEMPVMQEYLAAETELEQRLQMLNECVSEPLEIDFAEKAGGCCGD